MSSGAEYVAVARRHGGESKLLTAEALGALFSSTASLNAVASLQLFIPSHGGNSTQYVCEYSRDGVSTYASRCAVSKLAYVGLQGPEAMAGDAALDPMEEPQALPCNFRRLNEELSSATRRLVRCCEENSRCRVMACTALFVLDPQGVPWFVGARDVVTLPRPPREIRATTAILQSSPPEETPTPARSPRASRVPFTLRSSSLSAVGSEGTDFPAPCEGDYCRHPAMPSPGRGAPHADVDFVTCAAKLLPAADATTPAVGFHSVSHRTILLDRALQRRGVGLGDSAPDEALRLFWAEERRNPAVYAREAWVCDRCVCYYELFGSRRKVEEGAVRRVMRAEAEAAAAKAAVQAAAAADAAKAAADAAAATALARGRFAIYTPVDGGSRSPPAPRRAPPTVKDWRGGGCQMRVSQSTPALHGGLTGQGGATGRDSARTAAEPPLGAAPPDAEQGLRPPASIPGSAAAKAGWAASAAAGSGSAGLAHAYDAARETRRPGARLPAVGGRDGMGASAVEKEAHPDDKAGEGRGSGAPERAVRGLVMQRMAHAYALPLEPGRGAGMVEKRRPQLAAASGAQVST